MKLYTSKQDILDATRRVISRVNNAQTEWQRIALSAIAHCKEHGDKTVPASVIEGITKCNGVTKGKMRQYLEFGLNAVYEDGAFNYLPGKSHRDIDLDMAEAVKWYDFKVESGDTSKDLLALFEAFHKAAQRSLAKEKVTQAQIDTIEKAFVRASKTQDSAQVIELPTREAA